MRTRILIIAVAIIGMVVTGIALGRWAAEQSKACEASYQQAIDVLRNK